MLFRNTTRNIKRMYILFRLWCCLFYLKAYYKAKLNSLQRRIYDSLRLDPVFNSTLRFVNIFTVKLSISL